MKFSDTDIDGVYLVELERRTDDRGWFARSFCVDEFASAGIDFNVVQANISFNRGAGTLRGMHFQREPYEEAKVVRCVRGAIYDVAVDLRPDSATFRSWFGVELDADSARSLFLPEGCAHGFQTLTEDVEIHYLMSERYHPEAAAGVRYDDPAFAIEWPLPVASVSERDRSWPLAGT